MIRKRLWAGLVALCISVASWGQAVDSCYYSDGRAMVPVEEGVEALGFFAEHAPDGLLREECDKVYDPNSPCNKDMGDHHFKGFLELYNLVPVKRTSYLFSNYSGADDEGSMERRFRMTIPYFQKNHIVPLEPREETVVKGVKNYATFFAVGKNRVGYKDRRLVRRPIHDSHTGVRALRRPVVSHGVTRRLLRLPRVESLFFLFKPLERFVNVAIRLAIGAETLCSLHGCFKTVVDK